jgi:FAD/FMN-containing dehydrogenase
MSVDAALRADLAALLGEGGLVEGERLASRPRGERAGALAAALLVRPRDTQQVAAVLALCSARGQRVVPQGGLTGLTFGAAAGPDELVLSLEAMTRIEAVDVLQRTMRVQAGVSLQAAQEAAEQHGMLFPLDLGARASATIGGNIATNAGGMRVLRYGMMRSLTVGVEAVLADGTVLSSLNQMLKNNAGYDLKQLFIGTEGTLGVVTRAELRLFPRPRSQGTAFVACARFAQVAGLLSHLEAGLSGQLAAFEVLWPEFYALATTAPAPHRAALPQGLGIYVLIETHGAEPEADAARLEDVLQAALEQCLIVDAVIAKSEAERRALWAPREDVGQARRLGATHHFDVSLAVRDMPGYLDSVRARLRQAVPGAVVLTFGHVADGNLHLIVAAGDRHEATFEPVERCVYEPLAGLGASVSAEHGIGIERKAWLPISRTPQELATMRLLKRALDPQGILNPGKVIDVAAA